MSSKSEVQPAWTEALRAPLLACEASEPASVAPPRLPQKAQQLNVEPIKTKRAFLLASGAQKQDIDFGAGNAPLSDCASTRASLRDFVSTTDKGSSYNRPVSVESSALSSRQFVSNSSKCRDLEAAIAEYGLPHADTPAAALSESEATFSFTNLIFHYGMFSMPIVFAQNGDVTGSLLVLFCVGCCIFTGKLLIDVLDQLRSEGFSTKPGYGDAAALVGGPKLATIMSVAALAELVVYMLGGAMLLGKTLAFLFGIPFPLALALSALASTALSPVPDKMFAYVSLSSASCVIGVCIVVLISGFQLPQWAHDAEPFGAVSQMPIGLSLAMFCTAAHPVLPAIFNSCESKRCFERAMVKSWLFLGFCVVAFGVSTFYLFGDGIGILATQNIAHDLHHHFIKADSSLIWISDVLLVIKCQFSQVPISREIAECLAKKVGLHEVHEESQGAKKAQNGIDVSMVFVYATVFGVNGFLAWLLQDSMQVLFGLSGALLMNLNAFIFPGIAYLVVCKKQEWAKSVFAAIIVLASTVFACYSSLTAQS
eukprot:TRINITY_DN14408_c0_g1_i3.p1 TRINITY_DN14408_c0_g1~~TRINITY_DN14408_c0_g1_i3.p1  ORF type:complete len:539 (+),score=123.34 TRINITY_DN14408_c0_g1_i3:53-1669(+)